jgi:predicted HD phosphohydrolase
MDPRKPAPDGFVRMDLSTREQWMGILASARDHQAHAPVQVLTMLRSLEGVYMGFGTDQLHHALQTATLARRSNASDELVLAALCHDIGKVVSFANHPAVAAEILKPYVSEATYHIVRTHSDFQGRHYYHHFGGPRDLRERYRGEPWFAAAEQFTEEWDQAAFDPAGPALPLEEFEPLVNQYFGRFPVGG